MPLRWVSDTPGLKAGHRAGLVSVGLLPQAREEDEMFSGYSRWTTAGVKQAVSFFSLHHCSQHNLLNLSHLIAFSFLATNTPTLYFHHLTHIQNCFLVGAAPETRSKPLIQLQITGWKAVTSALGRSASHGSSSSPSLGDTLFITFIHPLSCDHLILPSHQLPCQGIGFYVSTNNSTQI